jgi:succinate-semialdehyde dehydrogenase / glutarate-semialdehyde dehydrogenase
MAIASVSPVTGQVLRTYEPLSDRALAQKIERAAAAFGNYKSTSFAERSQMMLHAAEILEAEKARFAEIITLEMGKPIRAARDEAAKCAMACRYYAETAERALAREVVATNASCSYIRYEPLGPILAIMPWNFPFWQVFRFAAPALMAGNVGLLKHSPNVPQCALAIEDILKRAGFPEGVFQSLLIEVEQVQAVLEDDRVAAATLTGSVLAGSKVAALAGSLIKKTVLELGGSDPFIVMPSANLEQAVTTAVKARAVNNGQSCIAAKRFIVADAVYDEFARGFVERMQALRIGDPMDESTNIGPLAAPQLLANLERQVNDLIAAGARVLTGGKRIAGPGNFANFYEPTVLADIPRGAPAACEELFGPVAMLFRVRDASEALQIANDSQFGLGASVWTNDPAERERFINDLESGQVFVNSMVASDPRLPFGGVKRSGYGRELGVFGIREFVNIKTVSIHEPKADTRKRMA